jgi:hypothetical protein
MRALAIALAAGAAAAMITPAAAEAVTTRIETRPFYGAVVTLEEGVRVFRPLPRHDRVIINPGGKTPLSLGYAESYNYSYSNNQYTGPAGGMVGPDYGPEYYGGFDNVVPRGRHHRRGGGRGGHHGGGSHGVR